MNKRRFRKASAFLLASTMIVSNLSWTMAADHNEESNPVVGKIIKNEYPNSVAETQTLIDNYVPIQRQMEQLNRGTVAVKVENGVFAGWRWLATESKDVAYNLYRNGEKVNALPITKSTSYLDTMGTEDSTYTVRAIVDGVEQEASGAVEVLKEQYLSVPLDIPTPELDDKTGDYTYSANDTSVGDLDGDGDYEIVLKWDPSNAKDNSQSGITGNVIIDAYEMDGTRLWRINLGKNVRAGAHYTQFMVYDLDGDGKAEVAMKTADGTKDAVGSVIGDVTADYRNEKGYIIEGPEYLTIFEGATGKIIDTIDFEPARGSAGDWGDDYGNRVDRFLAGIAYLDGAHPSLLMTRGYYEKTMLAAYDFVDGKLVKRWIFDSYAEGNEGYSQQGNHNLSVADVDYDGKDEIIFGAMAIDDDGTGLYTTGLGHGDALHVSDLDPNRPGLEVFQPHEHTDAEYGIEFRDARTGETIWGSFEGSDVGRGVSGDIDPNHAGAEAWAAHKLISANGELMKENPSIPENFMIWWDGDLGREFLDHNIISKWNAEEQQSNTILIARECASNNGTKSNPALSADLFGDWREEVMWRTKDSSELHIYTTTKPTDYRIYTLMQDPVYRLGIAWQNVAYNQPPHTGFYLGFETNELPIPQIYTLENGTKVENPDLELKEYNMDDLTNQGNIATFIGSSIALSKGKVLHIDSENEKAYIVNDYPGTLVPVNFISNVLGVEVSSDLNQTIINEIPYVSLHDAVTRLGKSVFFNDEGLIYISDAEISFTEKQADLLLDQLQHAIYVENVVKLYQGPRLRPDHLGIKAVESSSNDGNVAAGAVDSDMDTRWASDSDGYGDWLWIDLGEVQSVKGIGAAFFKGNERSYFFDLEVSTDNENWTPVLTEAASSGTTLEIEEFLFDKIVDARYIRYTGQGNSVNGYNNIYEFLVLGK